MKILFSGDVFGEAGRRAIAQKVPEYRQTHKVDFVICNGENVTHGQGIGAKDYLFLRNSGVNVVTGGNHSFKHRDIVPHLKEGIHLLRPANYLAKAPGRGYCVHTVYAGVTVAVINLVGRIFMEHSNSPFECIESILPDVKAKADIIIVDMHAETTSEKRAMGWFLDGKVSAVLGSHTHVQTADDEILPQGTAFITDVGMTGPYDSVIGVKKEIAINKFSAMEFQKFDPATGDIRFCAVVLDVDEGTGKARSIQRVQDKVL